ncbi:MAG: hypothetical protein NTZ32_11535, partial [Planctomycetales bacterium]|nr:hypothetical protein [Planctomycetales bacterium]
RSQHASSPDSGRDTARPLHPLVVFLASKQANNPRSANQRVLTPLICSVLADLGRNFFSDATTIKSFKIVTV